MRSSQKSAAISICGGLFLLHDLELPKRLRWKSLANHISPCLSVLMMENEIFRALADPTRRAIFEKLADAALQSVKEGRLVKID